MDLKQFLKTKWATVMLGGMLVLVMFVTIKLLLQKRTVDNEIALLEAKADEIHKSNQEMSELIKYFNTPEYAERQAREKLNLKKEGEHVLVLPKDGADEGSVAAASVDNQPNSQKWFNYFFEDKQ
jgi:cell division protein FtsB